MTKKQAVKLFGNQSRLAEALGISRAAVSKWPDGKLSVRHENEVQGALLRLRGGRK